METITGVLLAGGCGVGFGAIGEPPQAPTRVAKAHAAMPIGRRLLDARIEFMHDEARQFGFGEKKDLNASEVGRPLRKLLVHSHQRCCS